MLVGICAALAVLRAIGRRLVSPRQGHAAHSHDRLPARGCTRPAARCAFESRAAHRRLLRLAQRRIRARMWRGCDDEPVAAAP